MEWEQDVFKVFFFLRLLYRAHFILLGFQFQFQYLNVIDANVMSCERHTMHIVYTHKYFQGESAQIDMLLVQQFTYINFIYCTKWTKGMLINAMDNSFG